MRRRAPLACNDVALERQRPMMARETELGGGATAATPPAPTFLSHHRMQSGSEAGLEGWMKRGSGRVEGGGGRRRAPD